ncbi:response regulator [Aliarcobacter butzleri JV22]|uniref:hypothetical protein n=1 Tax=Aliarcobacter butzleri TaxID=28197 RepID=UPI0001F11E47|nr:hypothetical protein [Aliarcobacter butzleri]EFU68765.1 response regulator [Aliarcobacter butzleri JV22]MCT7628169.1 hypothetical protein [Aliarcobacter butzleri]
MKILIVEDDLNKLNNLEKFIVKYFKTKNIEIIIQIKNSYQSGLESILSDSFDLLLLDMSLPNFDTIEGNDSGAPLSRGGELILYEMDVMDINLKTIIVSMHDDFDGDSLEVIHNQYKEKFSKFYISYVFYNEIESNWENELEKILDGVSND